MFCLQKKNCPQTAEHLKGGKKPLERLLIHTAPHEEGENS